MLGILLAPPLNVPVGTRASGEEANSAPERQTTASPPIAAKSTASDGRQADGRQTLARKLPEGLTGCHPATGNWHQGSWHARSIPRSLAHPDPLSRTHIS